MIDNPAIIAYLQEREILRMYGELSERNRRRLMLYAHYLTDGFRRFREGEKKERAARPPAELSETWFRGLLAAAPPAEVQFIYRQAQHLRNAQKKPERE